MVWGCNSCDGIGPITKVDGRKNGKDYIRLLFRHLLPCMQSMGSSYVFMNLSVSKLLAGTVCQTSGISYKIECA